MLYLIGLGLNEKSLGKEALEAVRKCTKVYLEGYTIDFPYSIEQLEKEIGKKPVRLERKDVESSKIVNEAKTEDIALLVYGSPLFATTHLSLILDGKKAGIQIEVLHNASIFDALGEIGLELYKFGKITSMPAWKSGFNPDSFLNIVKENLSIRAHSLILCDIGLSFKDALRQLEESCRKKNMNIEKIVVASCLGTKKKRIYYNFLQNLEKIKDIKNPFCIIIPSELHFMEKEALEEFGKI